MSDDAEAFAREVPEIRSAESVTEGEYIHVYRAELEQSGGDEIRILSLAPKITNPEVREVFNRKAVRWQHPSTHPNIVTVYERGSSPRPWLAVADVGTQKFNQVRTELSTAEVGTVIADTAEAIQNASLYSTVHSALSPGDIWIVESGSGVSALVGGWGLERSCRVAAGENPLSLFLAPELMESPGGESKQTDIYGLGAVAYYGLTGQPPLTSNDDIASELKSGEITPPSILNPALTEAVDHVLLQALSPVPEDRHQSIREFKTAFTESLPVEEEIEPTDPVTLDRDQMTGRDDGMSAASYDDTSESTPDGTPPHQFDSPSGETTDGDAPDEDSPRISRRTIIAGVGLAGLGGVGFLAVRSRSDGADRNDDPSPDGAGDTDGTPIATPTDTGVDTPEATREPTPTDAQESELSAPEEKSPTETPGTPTPSADDDWVSTFRYGPANTGSRTSVSGPTTYLAEKWKFRANRGIFSSPALVDGVVYIGSDDGNVYALNASDGSTRWAFQTGDRVRSSPAVVEGTVYVGSDDGSLYAIDAEDGTAEWSFSTGRAVFSSPAVVDGTVYVGSDDRSLYALDMADGSAQWSFETRGSIRSSPAVADGSVYVGSNDTSLYVLDSTDGSEQWSFETAGSIRSSPTVVDSTVYVGSDDSNMYALNHSGEPIHWGEKWSYSTSNKVFSTPAVVSETVIFGGSTEVIAVDASDGSDRWRFETENGRVLSSPAVADGIAYIGCNDTADNTEDNTVYGIDISDGTQVTHFETLRGGPSSPAIGENVVYIGDQSLNVYALTEGY